MGPQEDKTNMETDPWLHDDESKIGVPVLLPS